MLFVAPLLSGSGPRFLGELDAPVGLSDVDDERIGDDLLITGYIHSP
jgi:hypothetical protein